VIAYLTNAGIDGRKPGDRALPSLTPKPGEIEVIPAMVEAGRKALYEAIGYQFESDPREAVVHVFKRMVRAGSQAGLIASTVLE